METQNDYLNRRAREEQAAADRAGDPKIRELHLELAARYLQAASDGFQDKPEDPAVPPQRGLPSDLRILE